MATADFTEYIVCENLKCLLWPVTHGRRIHDEELFLFRIRRSASPSSGYDTPRGLPQPSEDVPAASKLAPCSPLNNALQ